MINAKELRIGNYISDNFGNTGVITSIDKDLSMSKTYRLFFKVGLTTYDAFLEDVNPVPITEEILLKCGFTRNRLYHGCLFFYWNRRAVSYGTYDEYDANKEEVYIDTNAIMYLHQLQNLYFELIREELEINL